MYEDIYNDMDRDHEAQEMFDDRQRREAEADEDPYNWGWKEGE